MIVGAPAWNAPGRDFNISNDEVHVWRATLDILPSAIAELDRLLAPAERARASRFHRQIDRTRHVLGRGLLRVLLGSVLNMPPDRLQFTYNEFGKPSLAASCGLQAQFNVSHSADLLLIAIAIDRAVGVDVEQVRTDVDFDAIAARFFSVAEQRLLAALPQDLKRCAFYSCWTRKEAYLKARGDGLAMPLDTFDVSILPDEEPRLLETRHDPADARRWMLQNLAPGNNYLAALAVEGSGWSAKCWDWRYQA
jgi:4'-phosphopantetheinyl transferase